MKFQLILKMLSVYPCCNVIILQVLRGEDVQDTRSDMSESEAEDTKKKQ